MSSKKVILRHPRMRSLLRFSTLKRDKLESSANLQVDQKRKALFWVPTLLLRRLKKSAPSSTNCLSNYCLILRLAMATNKDRRGIKWARSGPNATSCKDSPLSSLLVWWLALLTFKPHFVRAPKRPESTAALVAVRESRFTRTRTLRRWSLAACPGHSYEVRVLLTDELPVS